MKIGLRISLGLVCLMTLASPEAALPAWQVEQLLVEGLRVKVEGRSRGNGLYEANEVTLKGDRQGDMSVEGLVGEVDSSIGAIEVSDISLRIDPSTEILAEGDRAISLQELPVGKRVIVDFGGENGRQAVQRIRALESRDQDVEVKAPIERIVVHGNSSMDLYVLNRRFQCDDKTAFLDPDGRQVEVDYSELDIYRRLVDQDDRRPASQLGFGDLLTIGGEVQVDLMPEKNFDLNNDTDSDIFYSKLSTLLELTSKPHPEFDLFLKIAAAEPTGAFDPFHPTRSESELRTAEAYLLWRRAFFAPWLGLKLGRQDFDEKREWLFDENLDAVRLFLNVEPALIELSASTNLSEIQVSNEGVINYILYGSYLFIRDSQVAAYIIHREDDDPIINYDRRWYGLRSFGDLGKSLSYWVELSLLRGERRGRELRSDAFDVGFTHVLNGILFEPSFTFGYAYGSGDADYRDNIDGNYRQTDFEDNNDKFNGVNSFRYYGEVFGPELSNLRVTTAGAGFRWSKDGSLDLVYHTYRQVVPDNSVHGSDLLSDPLGDNKSIGDEIDLILGYEKLWNIDLDMTVGFFRPGSAYHPNTETASRSKLQIEYNF